MRIRPNRGIVVAIVLVALGAIAQADTYSTFQTTRYYSANHRYFVKATPNKRITLYRTGRSLQKVWSSVLPELPSRMFISNDGGRVVMIEYAYGNNRSPSANVVIFFDENGNQIANHTLGEVANLSRVMQTVSSAHWYYGALFTPDQSTLVVETIVRKCEAPTSNVKTKEDIEALEACMKPQPYEELRFSMASGKLISRADIQTKYTDPEKRLLHELELVENEYPPDNLSLVYALLELARFHEGQRQYARAKDFYNRAIPIYGKTLGENYSGVAAVIASAATNYRNLGDYHHAEQFYRRALASLDKRQGNPNHVAPVAITVYEEYAVLLHKLNRVAEAEKMEGRAKVLRSVYPDKTP